MQHLGNGVWGEEDDRTLDEGEDGVLLGPREEAPDHGLGLAPGEGADLVGSGKRSDGGATGPAQDLLHQGAAKVSVGLVASLEEAVGGPGWHNRIAPQSMGPTLGKGHGHRPRGICTGQRMPGYPLRRPGCRHAHRQR